MREQVRAPRNSGGPLSQPGVSAFGVLGAKPERQDEQENAKNERVRAEPPGQHQSADQRRDNQEDAIDKRRQSAQSEPPSPMVQLQAKRRRGHQCAPVTIAHAATSSTNM